MEYDRSLRRRFRMDSQLPEHPVKVGTPIPATLSLYGIFGLSSVIMFIIGAGVGVSQVDESDTRLLAIGAMFH